MWKKQKCFSLVIHFQGNLLNTFVIVILNYCCITGRGSPFSGLACYREVCISNGCLCSNSSVLSRSFKRYWRPSRSSSFFCTRGVIVQIPLELQRNRKRFCVCVPNGKIYKLSRSNNYSKYSWFSYYKARKPEGENIQSNCSIWNINPAWYYRPAIKLGVGLRWSTDDEVG